MRATFVLPPDGITGMRTVLSRASEEHFEMIRFHSSSATTLTIASGHLSVVINHWSVCCSEWILRKHFVIGNRRVHRMRRFVAALNVVDVDLVIFDNIDLLGGHSTCRNSTGAGNSAAA